MPKITRESGPGGQQVIHREHLDGRIDVVVRPATINVRAKARLVDVAVSETVQTDGVSAKMRIEGGDHGEG